MKQLVPGTDEEILEIVDEEDRVVGRMERSRIHAEGRMHRSVHIFVWDLAGRLFVQKRAMSKDQYPGKWDSSAAGHVDPGESYQECARRELEEELGIRATPRFIAYIPASEYTGWEFISFFEVHTADPITIDEQEISEGRYFSREEIESLLETDPERFAPALPALWRLYHAQRDGG